ncbi:MAG: hypothetical protein M2R45_00578 [Verrucomicrobia subdivision 3 bacterium]|nr:hypothetical protein [Limisphaerales bacterium]MCS1413545.1 hypothetical protein [Limisphaerales bacterium]
MLRHGLAGVQASQAGNANFDPAETVLREFFVNSLSTISGLTDQMMDEGGSIGPLLLRIEDLESP